MNTWLSALGRTLQSKKVWYLVGAVLLGVATFLLGTTTLPAIFVALLWGGTFFLVMSFVFAWARNANAASFLQAYTTRDIVYMGMLIALGGVFKAYWGQARMMIEAVFGPYAVFVISPGFYIWAIFACHLVRRPFSGTISMVLGGVVEILAGNPFGIPVLMFNFWEGFGPDVSYNFIFKNKRYDIWVAFVGGTLSALFGLWYGWLYFGFSQLPFWAFVVYVLEVIAGGLISAVLGYGILRVLEAVGVKPPKPAVVH